MVRLVQEGRFMVLERNLLRLKILLAELLQELAISLEEWATLFQTLLALLVITVHHILPASVTLPAREQVLFSQVKVFLGQWVDHSLGQWVTLDWVVADPWMLVV